MCVCTHTFLFPAVSFPLPAFLGWKNFITVALPLFSFLGESAQSSLSVALLCLCSLLSTCFVSTSKLCHIFLILGGCSTRFPQCVCKSTPPFSEMGMGFYSILFRFLLLAQCTLVCLRSLGHSSTLLSWLYKVMVRKCHNHLLITI